MGDWVQVETGKQRTLTGIFMKYICIFCVNTVLLALLMVLSFSMLINMGAVLPANYMERYINENREEIINAGRVTEDMLPVGSRFGVYDKSGGFLYGNLEEKNRKNAWAAYKENDTFADGGGLYRFLLMKNEELCIVKYYIRTQAANEYLQKILPAPEFLFVILFILLFFLQAAAVSRHFARMLSGRLKALKETTEKIRSQNLEIGEEHSDILEIDEALRSLSRMGKALKESLDRQWRLERHKREQVAALAHDIKTPLTVIKGNAELLHEEIQEEACKEYNTYIQENVAEIENYLHRLQDMLLTESGEETGEAAEAISAKELAERLKERAKELAAGYSGGKIRAAAAESDLWGMSGEIWCNMEEILRAWDNIVSNALEHTPGGRKIRIVTEAVTEGGKRYLAARVIDKGQGFTKEELLYAREQFYQGDKSRHGKNHRGLGLYTASQFARRQGGQVVLENEGLEGYGARVTLLLVCKG